METSVFIKCECVFNFNNIHPLISKGQSSQLPASKKTFPHLTRFYYYLLYLPTRQIHHKISVHFQFSVMSFSDWQPAVRGGSAHRRAAFRWQQSYTRCFLHPEKAVEHSRCGRWVVPVPGGIQTSWESFQKPADLNGFPAVLWSYVILADPNVLATQPLLPGWGPVIMCPQSAPW